MSSAIFAIDARLVGGSNTGDSTYWTSLVRAMARTAPDAPVVLFGNGPRPAGLEGVPYRWESVPARVSRWWSLAAFPLRARQLGARAIHTQYTLSPLAGPRGITTVHDVSFLIGPEWFLPKDRLILSRTVPASMRRARAVITVSETSKREILQFVPELGEKVRVTYNACPDWIHPVERAQARETVRSLGVDGPYALTVSTRWPRKNMNLAVEAMEQLPESLPHRLVLTGKTGWGDHREGSRVKAVGYVDEATLCALYSAADLYISPSRHEGFGVPLLEAFRCGCPVVCSTGGALPEVAGDAAAVETSWTPEGWSRRIEGLLTAPGTLEELRQRGLARERRFSWDDTARQTLAIYGEEAR